MENNTEIPLQTSEATAEMSENTEFGRTETSNELPLPQLPNDALSELAIPIPQNPVYDGEFPSQHLKLVGSNLIDTSTNLNEPVNVLNGLSSDLNEPVKDLNTFAPVLNEQPHELNGLSGDLNNDAHVLIESEAVLTETPIVPELQAEKVNLKPALIPIFQYVKAQPIRTDKVVLKPVGIDEAVFNELKAITEQGGIPISRYCSEVLRHHEDVLSLQLMKNELAEFKQLYNEQVNENLHLMMDKKKVEESAQLLVSTSQAHLNAKQETLSELQQKQLELDKANQTIATLRLGIDNVSDEVQKAYEDYLGNVLPETLKAALADTYNEIVTIVKSNRLPKDFEAFENFFYDSYQRNMELIKKQQEIIQLAQSKKNGI